MAASNANPAKNLRAGFSERIPLELRNLPQWVLWRYEDRGGPKPTKVPYQARTRLYRADSTDPRTWASHETAAEMAQHHAAHVSGIGFVFSLDDPYTGIDLDSVWQCDADEGARWAMGILERFADTYLEGSPSDRGCKIWCRAKAPRCGGWKIEHGGIEIYDHSRFFTVTGRSNRIFTIADHQEDIEQLVANLDGGKANHPPRIDGVIRFGSQHNTLVSLAGTMHRRGMSPSAVEAALLEVNRTQCERPGPEENIRKIVASMAKWSR